MLLSNVRYSLDRINNDLKSLEDRRERILKSTREVVALCSKSIIALHYNNKNESNEKIQQARKMLDELRSYAKTDLYKYLSVAEQEFVEACCMLSIVDKVVLPDMDDLKVTQSSYIMGLLDCIGEVKRMVYDKIRSGQADEAIELFSLMEKIYGYIYPFAIYDNMITGLRRKLDVAKMLIENIRAIITEESRRQIVIKSIDELEKKMQKIISNEDI